MSSPDTKETTPPPKQSPSRIDHLLVASGAYDLAASLAEIREALTARWIEPGRWSCPVDSWIQELPPMEKGDRDISVRVGHRGGAARCIIRTALASATLDVIMDPETEDDGDALHAHLLDAIDAVSHALETLPPEGGDPAIVADDKAYGTDMRPWLIAAAMLGRRHHPGAKRDLSFQPRTPWSPTLYMDADLEHPDFPQDVVARLDKAIPSSIRVWLDTIPSNTNGPLIRDLRIMPMEFFPEDAGDASNPDDDPIATLRAMAMAVEAGAMDA